MPQFNVHWLDVSYVNAEFFNYISLGTIHNDFALVHLLNEAPLFEESKIFCDESITFTS